MRMINIGRRLQNLINIHSMKRKIIAAGGLIVNEKEEVLMIFRRDKWDLPKGKLEEGEDIRHCAIREVQEETGLQQVTAGERLAITYHDYFDTWSQEEVTKETHWYAMQAPGEQPLIPQTEEDITKIIWADAGTVKKNLQESYPTIVEVINKWKQQP